MSNYFDLLLLFLKTTDLTLRRFGVMALRNWDNEFGSVLLFA